MTFSPICSVLEARRNERAAGAARIEGRHDELARQLADVRKSGEAAELRALTLADALNILRAYSELQEKVVRERLESIVTAGLRAVFGDEQMAFRLRFELARGQMTAVPIISTGSGDMVVETEATDARGGGVLDVAAFLIRCVMLVLYRPALSRVLVLDETFKHLSRNHLPRAAELVQRMSEKLGIQIILVSHKDEFAEVAERVFDVSIREGITSIRERGAI